MGQHKYENEKIKVFWDSDVCIHSAVCIKNLGNVFNTQKKPWINVDAGSVDEITTLIDTCPSGALSYEVKKFSEPIKSKSLMNNEDVKITVSKNGPYIIKGSFDVEDAEGNPVETKGTAALCRCGSSSNKPFCDGTHSKMEFEG